MKKLLIGILVLVVIGGGAMFYLSSNAGDMIRHGVITYVPPIIGADVELAKVDLDPANGAASVTGLVIGNPEGFKSSHAFKIDNMSVKLDIKSLTSDVIHINEIRLDAPDMIYEIGTKGNNIGKIQENVDKYVADLGLESSDDSELKYIIDHVYINGTKVQIASDLVGGRGAGVTLPNLDIADIGKRENGAIATDVLKQIFGVVNKSVSQVAQSEMLGDVKNKVNDAAGNVVKELEGKVADQVGEKLKGLIPQK
ncbi:MAG: hypothetical protein R3D86_12515 [Emcibacteraceae bacterium]